jgi:hypothetical protein
VNHEQKRRWEGTRGAGERSLRLPKQEKVVACIKVEILEME